MIYRSMLLLVVISAAALAGCGRDIENPLFDAEEIAVLNDGGSIDSTNPKLAIADEVCLIGPDNIRGSDYRGCILTPTQSMALIRDGQCTLYSVDGLKGRVFAQHDKTCRPVAPGFELYMFDRYGTKHLVFSDEQIRR